MTYSISREIDSASRFCLSETLNLRVYTLFKQLIPASIVPYAPRTPLIETLAALSDLRPFLVLLGGCEAWKEGGSLGIRVGACRSRDLIPSSAQPR